MLRRLSDRNPLLPPALILAVIFILIAAGFWLVFEILPTFEPEPTPIAEATLTPIPSLIPTRTPTITPSPRPTWTLRPTSTPTATQLPTGTPTPTLFPTLNNANPLRFNNLYRLVEWDADRADSAIAFLESYPNSLFPTPDTRVSPDYYRSFFAASIAQREALLRFPEDPRADAWRWGLAFNLARQGDPSAGAEYASIITEALNEDKVEPEDLPAWFSNNEPRLTLEVLSLPEASEASNNSLLNISGEGAAVIWLIETPNGFQSHLLRSHFDFTGDLEPGVLLANLAGNETPEVILFENPSPGSFVMVEPEIYSLESIPPVRLDGTTDLPFDLGTEFETRWLAEGENILLQTDVFPSCPVEIRRIYGWNGQRLALEDAVFTINPDPNMLEQCAPIIDHAARFWGPEAAASLTEQLEEFWPPKVDLEGNPLPQDAFDELRYRHALYYIFSGDREAAIARLQEIISRPSDPASRWIGIAEESIEVVESEQDAYRVCALSTACDRRLALQYVVSQFEGSDSSALSSYLQDTGVTISGSSVFDFENDSEPERWILVRQRPEEKLELWIITNVPGGARALFVQTVETAGPQFRYHEPVEDPPIVQMELKRGFILRRVPETGEPYLHIVDVAFVPTTFTLDALEEAKEDLFAGADPALVREDLMLLLGSERFNCRTYQICDQFLYILGLAFELSGRTTEAIDTYIEQWWETKNSLLTVLARQKLEVRPDVTLTPPTPTRTATRTPRGTQGTPGPTSTPSPTITSTLTATP